MERGAANAAGRNAKVDDMDEWRKARERRASSARHPSDEYREYRRDDPPFWEQDDPFGSHRKAAGRQAKAERERPRLEAREQPRRDARQQPQRDERQSRRQEYYQPGRGDRRQPSQTPRQQQRPHEHERNSRQNMLLMLMAMLGLAAIAVVIGLNVFRIRNIDVKGNDTVSAQSIIALSGISVGENIFKANLPQARRNIESDPLLEVLGISRVFPDGISIEIRQRIPHGAIAYLGSYVIIDEKGFVLDVRDSLPAGQYPLVTGIEIQPSEKGKPLAGVDGVQLKTMYDLLTALYDNKAMQYVSEANLGNGGDIRLLTGEGMVIDLGKPTDLDRKAQWIACSVPELRSRGYTSGVLYITGADNPVYSESDSSNASQDSSGDSAAYDGGADSAAGDGETVAGSPGNAA
jgi:cell division protein FtsQ